VDPVSIVTVAIAALSSSLIKGVVSDLWERFFRRRHESARRVTIVGPSGVKIELDTREPLNDERIREIMSAVEKAK
jgi:hypothetical protein